METNDYCSYELSKALKVAGFDEPCYFYYTRENAPEDHVWSTTSEEAPIDYNKSVYAGCSMPTLAQAQKWLREVKGVDVEVRVCVVDGGKGYEAYVTPPYALTPTKKDYESALSAGIASALELIEQENK